jgi:2-C-methyl-D-erythritol 2,4-cyclodiphosphate synthase
MGGSSTGFGFRVGIGYDVHRLVDGRKLILGGERIDHPTGLLGHSDADVLTHAIMSAILGAMAAGSLGDHFPDTDPQYKDVRSIDLLERVRILMEESGYEVENVDTMVICDQPRLGRYIDKIKLNLGEALRVPIECVSVKATSTEGLGFTGTGEGIAAQAVVLLKKPVEIDEADYKDKKIRKTKTRKSELPPPLPKIKPGEYKHVIARTDGASDPNPGPSGIGIVFETPDGIEIGKISEHIGENTNNQTEYKAAIIAATIVKSWGAEKINLVTDSQLMEKQLKGSYKIKNPGILNLYRELMTLLIGFKSWDVKHVGREENEEADRLSKLALKKQG